MLIVRTILVELFLLQSMVWLPLQSGPIKQANAMMYYNHFTDEKVAVQGRLDSHNPALRILEQNRRCLSQLPRSGFLSKPPLTPSIYCVSGTVSGAGKRQSYDGKPSVLTPSRNHHHP